MQASEKIILTDAMSAGAEVHTTWHSVAPMKQLLTPIVAYFLPQLGRKIGEEIYFGESGGRI